MEMLKFLLNRYQADFEAWNELCLLYLTECDYKKAAFCMEELILSNPHNHVFMSKYAEVSLVDRFLCRNSYSHYARARIPKKKISAWIA